jgi:subtilisin family serine protease
MSRSEADVLLIQDGNAAISSVAGAASKRMDMNFKLFKGASIQFKDAKKAEDKAAELASRGDVKNVWPVKLYSVPTHTVHSVGDAALSTLRRRQGAGPSNDTFTPHLMTQVDKLKAKGVTGKGIKIAVIDTGVSAQPGPSFGLTPYIVQRLTTGLA